MYNYHTQVEGIQISSVEEYYRSYMNGVNMAGKRNEKLEKYLEGGSAAMSSAGCTNVVLKNVIKMDKGGEQDIVAGARWHEYNPQNNEHKAKGADACPLNVLKESKMEYTHAGEWEERQSVFDTPAWHAVRGWAPNSNECIKISTRASIREMMLPGVYAIFTPVFVGFLVGARMLMGVLAGSVGAGAMLAIMMANAGGAWDNSKKYIEIAGAKGGKGTDTHKACVVGDTVGDPFKDTSGPSLNILLKLMAMVSLTIATLLKGQDDWEIGWFAFIPGVIILGATFYYCKYIYGAAEEKGRKAEVTSATQPDSPKKQTWHVEADKNAQGEVEHGYFQGNPAAQV